MTAGVGRVTTVHRVGSPAGFFTPAGKIERQSHVEVIEKAARLQRVAKTCSSTNVPESEIGQGPHSRQSSPRLAVPRHDLLVLGFDLRSILDPKPYLKSFEYKHVTV